MTKSIHNSFKLIYAFLYVRALAFFNALFARSKPSISHANCTRTVYERVLRAKVALAAYSHTHICGPDVTRRLLISSNVER